MIDGFAKITKAFKKDLKKASQKEKKRKHDSDSDSSWSVGLSSTGDSNALSKSKRLKLDIPSSPLKTTLSNNFDSLNEMLKDTLEQTDHTILQERKIGVTAVVATIRSGPELRPKVEANKNKNSKPKISSKTKVPNQE